MNQPPKPIFRAFTVAHVFLYRHTGGRIGGRIPGGQPVQLLTTTGRKSGTQRTTPLLYLRDGDNYVIVASNGGAPRHPAWWLNLKAQGTTEIQVGGARIEVAAHEAEGSERERLWEELTSLYSGYADYQKKTKRRIPVVALRAA